jgi:hypothetical protein
MFRASGMNEPAAARNKNPSASLQTYARARDYTSRIHAKNSFEEFRECNADDWKMLGVCNACKAE